MTTRPHQPGAKSTSDPKNDGDRPRPVLILPEDEFRESRKKYDVTPNLIVRFRDEIDLDQEEIPAQQLLKRVSGEAAKRAEDVVLRPHYEPSLQKKLAEKHASLKSDKTKAELPRLRNFTRAEVRDRKLGHQIAEDLGRLDEIQYAYLHPEPVEPPQGNPSEIPSIDNQLYLDPAPDGINAHFAQTVPGGDGQNQRLADVEWGWNHDHEELSGISFTEHQSGSYKWIPHGTKVLGVIAAQDNGYMYLGITPNLDSVVTVGQWPADTEHVTDTAVWLAISELGFGDVLLLEAQTDMFGYGDIPLEAMPAVFEAVSYATSVGITVVAAAGNGGHDLDFVTDTAGVSIFDTAVRDSGAILVGSASPDTNPKWIRMNNSCHGSRVDCFAQGAGVHTISTDEIGDEDYGFTPYFGFTSAASAIVAGAALSVQGVAEAGYNVRFGAPWMRLLLSASQLNTPSANQGSQRIGVMPDLQKIIDILPYIIP